MCVSLSLITLLREELGLNVIEREIDRSELYLADEAFFCETGVQIAAIASIDHRVLGQGGTGPAKFRSSTAGRDMAAWLCRRWSGEPLRALGPSFGLKGTDSVSNIVRRAEAGAAWRRPVRRIKRRLGLNTAHKA